MPARFNLYIQKKDLGPGTLTLQDDASVFWTGTAGEKAKQLATMTRVQIDHASTRGIQLSGIDKGRYQEWWLVFLN